MARGPLARAATSVCVCAGLLWACGLLPVPAPAPVTRPGGGDAARSAAAAGRQLALVGPNAHGTRLPLMDPIETYTLTDRGPEPISCPVLNVSPMTPMEQMRPSFIIVGGQKCGTTSMYNYLIRHPNVLGILSPMCTDRLLRELKEGAKLLRRVVGDKEVRFFDSEAMAQRNASDYIDNFPYVPSDLALNRITGESTPNYVYPPYVAARIRHAVPDIRLIFLLRDPVERAFSHYVHALLPGRVTLSFEQAINIELGIFDKCDDLSTRVDEFECHRRLEAEYFAEMDDAAKTIDGAQAVQAQPDAALNGPHADAAPAATAVNGRKRKSTWILQLLHRGLYADQMLEYLRQFPLQQLLVIRSEDMYSDTEAVMARVAEFLGLPDIDWTPITANKYVFGRRNAVSAEAVHLDSATEAPPDSEVGSRMGLQMRDRLRRFFKPHNERLYSLLDEYGIPFTPWDY